jgi:spore maturation protein CgeB
MANRYRIFQAISNTASDVVAGNKTWYRNLYEPLVEMGHDVVLFSTVAGEAAMAPRNKRLRDDFSQRLLESFQAEHRKKPFDLFFGYFKEGMVDAGVFEHINAAGVPTCNFSCNNAHQFYLVENLAPKFTYSLHSEKDARQKFLSVGANPLWWPMASNPKYFRPEKCARTIDVSFVGANYGIRARYIKFLIDSGIDVHVFGPGWQSGSRSGPHSFFKRCYLLLKTMLSQDVNQQSRMSGLLAEHDFKRMIGQRYPANIHAPVSDAKLIHLYSTSKISLGFLEAHENHDPGSRLVRHIHLREFEAPMCGALYCTGYLPELAEMFEPDVEMIMYRDEDEFLDKIRYYLAHADEAARIRRAGHRRALQDHTYHRRFQQLFTAIGI